jgi:hypothetical protein
MNRHQRGAARRAQLEQTAGADGTGSVEDFAEYVLRDTTGPEVVVGPVCWRLSDGTTPRRFYFTVATSDAEGFRCDALWTDAEGGALRARLELFAEFIRRGRLVIHDVDDELAMAKLCEALWPGERITAIRKRVEAERAANV